MIYYLKEEIKRGVHSGSKARLDCEKIISSLSDEKIQWNFFSRKDILFKLPIQVINTIINVKDNDFIIIQYPYYANISKYIYKIFKFLKEKKNIKFIILIHDLDSIRSDNDDKFKDEINILNIADTVIVHNSKMCKLLIESGLKSNIIELKIFDYLCNIDKNKNINFSKKITIAGNLDESKSEFVYKLNRESIQADFDLYGPNYSEKMDIKGITYKGVEKPDILVDKLREGFGLIWDGQSINTCDGSVGKYLRYNNPHKLSLYLAAGIPVISWSKSAISDFIIENNIGFVVDSLEQLQERLDNIDIKKYNDMIKNIETIRNDIVNGNYLKNALEKALNKGDIV